VKKKQTLLILAAIILLAAFLRFYSLSDNRIGFFRDEAALGFNTWSILKTGADEYGQNLPIIFRSFEVFFLPAYVYLSIPIFYFFGLTTFSARALSALSGVLLVPVAYLIVDQLSKSKKIGLLAAFLTAISPWSIFYSRGAFEGNLALLFFSIGFYFWLRFINLGQNKFYFFSITAFIASMYSYQAPRLVAPLFIGISILIQKRWWRKWKLWLAGGIFALVLYSPIAMLTTSSAGYHRAIGVSIFSNENGQQKYSKVPQEMLSLYASYFSPNNLFLQSDYNPQRRVIGFSVFYLWQFPLLIFGLYKIFKSKDLKIKNLLVWLLIAPIPASLTRDPFHTYRALLFFLPVTVLITFGADYLLSLAKKYKHLILFIIVPIIIYSLSSYYFALFKTTAVINWRDWDYGYDQISEFIKKDEFKLYRVVIDDPNTTSYIHLLYNQAVSLSLYQESANTQGKYYITPDILRPQKVGRFEFKKVDWPSERGDPNTLFIFPSNRLHPSEFSGDPKLSLEKTIYAPSGEAAFYIIKTKT